MRQTFVALLFVGLAACGEKKSEPAKTEPAALSNPQPSDPSPAGRTGQIPPADKPAEEAKPKEPSSSQVAREREAIRRKIRARADKMAPPVERKSDPTAGK